MEKRLIAFLVLSTLLIFAWMQMAAWLHPPRPKQVAVEEKAKPPVAKPAEGEEMTDETPAIRPAPSDNAEEPTPRPKPPQQWFTLGSIDPQAPYRLLATLTNRGAAVERLELNNLRFGDVEDTSGYLGHLALTTESGGGCRVNVVGAGTPAAQAVPNTPAVGRGLQVGDVIRYADRQPIEDPEDLRNLLGEARPGEEYKVQRGKKPGETVELVVRRQVGGQTQELTFAVTLGKRPMQIVRPEWSDPDAPATRHPGSFLLTLESIGKAAIGKQAEEIAGLPSLYEETWEATAIPNGVEFRFRLDEETMRALGQSGALEIVKRYRLVPVADPKDETGGYHLDFDLEIHNLGEQPQDVAYRLNGPNGLPLEGWWYLHKIHPGDIRYMFSAAGARDVIWRQQGWSSHSFFGAVAIAKQADKGQAIEMFQSVAHGARDDLSIMANAGVDAQYFAAALVPSLDPTTAADDPTRYVFQRGWAVAVGDVKKLDSARRKTANVSYRLASVPHRIAPGEQYRESFRLFAGPKQPEILAAYGLSDYIYFGWFWWVSRPMVKLLHFFYWFLHNYALAIILLTLLVRGLMFPLGRRAAMNAKKMQELAPEMKVIAEKYKNDMQKRAEAQQELFRKHNYHPLSGCLPLFLQLPIFLGLYRCLAVDIELRGAPLIPGLGWCSNLAAPDMLWFWEPYLFGFLADPARGWLGPFFNLLPMVTIGLFLVHQKLFMPPPTDEQTRLQYQVMMFMTVFMGVMFFRVPAGLCVYFIMSSLWGIFERTVLLPKSPPPGESPSPDKKTEDAKEEKKPLFGLGGNGANKLTPQERRKQRQKRR